MSNIIDLKYDIVKNVLLVSGEDAGLLFKSVGTVFVPVKEDSPDLFKGTLTLPILVESKKD